MAKQSLMWTALPNGFDSTGALRVSALLSPRLEPDADEILKPFGDLVDWPETVRNARFIIQYGGQNVTIPGNETVAPARVDGSIDLCDSAAWTALIPETTFVRGYVFQDLSNNVVLSYDTMAMDSLTRNLYVALGRTTSDQLPKVSQILTEPHWQGVIAGVATIDRMFTEEKKKGLRDPAKQFARYKQDRLKIGGPVIELLARAQLFHTPPSTPQAQDYSGAGLPADDPRKNAKWRTYRRTALPAKEDFATELDFHQIVTAINPYPRLLRRLGLVIDFIIPKGAFSASSDQPLSVICELASPAQPGVTREQASSRTRALLSSAKFSPVPRPNAQAGDYRVRDGLLEINSDLFGLLQNDVDAAGLKVMNFARTLRLMLSDPERQRDPVSKFENEAGAPALRNAGLMLVHRRRGLMLENAFAYNKTKDQAIKNALQSGNNALAPDLFTEDLIRGWRIDIWDGKTKRWRSLCERGSEHLIAGSLSVSDEREGTVRLAATKSSDPASNPNLVYLHEALLSWTGWSLVARPPGLAIDKNDVVGSADAEVPPGLLLSNTFTAKPGSLPRLRYGRRYWVRARMVDLAANSIPPNESDYGPEHPEQNAVRYLRFEPLQAPSVALVRSGGIPEKPAEGESMERVAIRSFNDTPADNTIPTTQAARRYVVPARSNVKEAELHGALDAGVKVDGSQPTFTMLGAKDKAIEEVKLITPGPLSAPGATIETSYAVMDEPANEIPYLPDPLCFVWSARVFDHPTFPDSSIIPIPAYSSGGVWPDAVPFTIRVFEDATKLPAFDTVNRVLEIPLPKAIRATVRLSCQLSAAALDLMGVWHWLPAADRAALAGKARDGQHWMLSPWRNVEVVHAVQKPLIAPKMKFGLARGFGETRALPQFTTTCSLKSTSRLDLQAVWDEPDADAESTPIGSNRARADHAYSIKITDEKSYAMRKLDPKATGIPEHDIAGTDLITVGMDAHDTIIKFHEFSDTRYRRVQYWLEATTRFREFMPPDILTEDQGGTLVETDENIKVTGPSLVTWIPNSAPPPAPEVLYVVPTFGWTSTKSAQGVESRWRRGGGLRVYLDRPWNVSGYGEMLAVVVPRAGFTGDPNTQPQGKPYKKFVTQWGNDPIWTSAFVPGATPTAANFPLRRTAPDPDGKWLPSFAPATEADQPPGFTVQDLPHPALGPLAWGDTTGLVDIAPHDVFYDTERRLWYCDIEVSFGAAYYPFIRLALARYQPGSLPSAHLSNIVLADFMSLAADRWLTVGQGADPRVRNVSVYGYTYSESGGNVEAKAAPSTVLLDKVEQPATVSPTSVVEVWVEQLNPALGEDFGWQRITNAVITPASAATLRKRVTSTPTQAAHFEQALLERRYEAVVRENLVNPLLLWPTRWSGTVTLPQLSSPSARYRLVIAEYEEYLVDDLTAYNLTPSAKGRRLVFVDHVELT